MRNRLLAGLVLVAAMAATASADDVAGVYDVKFEEMASNCKPIPVTLTKGKLTIEVRKGSLTVNTDLIPQMAGVPAKNGKVDAKTTKFVPSTFQGLDGKYSIAGRVDDSGTLAVVLVAEYQNHDTKKPFCTQSWNVTGPRQGAAGKKSAELESAIFPM